MTFGPIDEIRIRTNLSNIKTECPNCRAGVSDRHAWGCPFGTNSKILLKLAKQEPEGLEEEHF